jgi:hypothetical protein
MDKYISISKIVMNITEDALLRTFFTVYLFEDDDAKRNIIDEQFWADLERLPDNQKATMREKFRACFKQLPFVVAQWGQDVDAYIATQQLRKVA